MRTPQRPTPLSAAIPTPGASPDTTSISNLAGFPLIRCAESPRGLLTLGQEAELRRYVLDATSFAASAARVEAIQRAAHVQMAHRMGAVDADHPGNGDSFSQTVHVACLGWPVVITMPKDLRVSAAYPLTGIHSSPLASELKGCLARAYDADLLEVLPLALYRTPLLLGLSPLSVHQLLATFKRALKSSSASAFRDCQLPISIPSERLGIGPFQPVAMVMPVLVAWRYAHRLDLGCGLNRARERMANLIAAVFTHYVPTTQGGTQQDWQEQVLAPTVIAGTPQLLFEAATQAQWLQLAQLSRQSRKSGLHSRHEQSTLGEFRVVEYELSDEDAVVSTLRYAYEPFWQPSQHRDVVEAKLAWTQATGCMPDLDCQGLH